VPRLLSFVLCLLVVFAAPSLGAQQRDSTPGQKQPDTTARTATPATSGIASAIRARHAPIIDGKEDDEVWRDAPAAGDFLEFQPTEGKAPRYRTTFKAAYDDRNLYIFIRAYDPHPDSIMRSLSRRDVRGPSDQLKIVIDAYHDRRSGYEFAVNPVGVKRDYAVYNDVDEDDSWDGVWDVGTTIDSLGWTAEYRIPFSQLRFANTPTHTFGFGVWRDIERYKERTGWPLYRQSQNTFMSQMGKLEGISGIGAYHRLEITPYVVAKNITAGAGIPVEPWRQSQKGSVGADLKYGVTPNLTLDATVNPDFGQVESDPAVLNLSAFETFFSEKRPFFLEGTGLYRYDADCNIVNCSGEGLFYSRRIGRSPQLNYLYGGTGSASFTPILGASKLTGRLPHGLNVGVMEAVTDRTVGQDAQTTEPLANYAVVRAQQDLRGGESGIGVILTGVNRKLDQYSDPYLRRDAYSAGLNARHKFAKARYEITANVMGSDVRGSPQAIAATQQSSVHFYQRPDDNLAFDSTRTSLRGDAEEVALGKIGGGVIRFQTSYMRQSPGFEINDVGFLRRANQQSWSTWGALQLRTPKWIYRSLQANFNEWNYWTAEGLPMEHAVNTNWHTNLKNNMWVHFGGTIAQLGDVFCDNCARGGPAMRVSPAYYPWFGIQGDDRRRIVPEIFFNFGRADEGRSTYRNINGDAEVRLMTQLQINIGFSATRNVDNTQFFGSFDGGLAPTHYSFAHLNQETLSLNTRWSYTATPTLTFQLYAEPFVSRGRYTDIRELSADPRAKAYDDRYISFTPPPNTSLGFKAKQLRSNTVMRWEYRPGSSLFLVWTHGRDDYQSKYQPLPWKKEYKELFALHPDNTFLVKLTYWLNR
jgi:hypothetical protein